MPRRPPIALLMLGLLAMVAGCGGGSSTSTAPTPPATSPARVAVPTATPTPKPVSHPNRSKPTPKPSPTASPTRSPRAKTSHPPRQAAHRRVTSSSYTFPLRCSTSYGRSHHDYPATDIFAPRNCHFVAPTNGRVDEVGRSDNWDPQTDRGADRGGRFVSIVGDDGVRYYGSHLDHVATGLQPGQRVQRGDVLGFVGNSGNARGIATHVHFGLSWPTRPGIWWVRRGEVYPWPYLDSWRAGGDRSPAKAVAAEHRQQGDEPPCRSGC